MGLLRLVDPFTGHVHFDSRDADMAELMLDGWSRSIPVNAPVVPPVPPMEKYTEDEWHQFNDDRVRFTDPEFYSEVSDEE